MGKTFIPTGSTAAKKIWDEKIWREAMKQSYFKKFMNNTGTSIVFEKEELMKSKGDTIYFGLRSRLDKGYLPSGTPVEGNENALTTYQDSVVVDEKNFGIRDGGMIVKQRAFYDLDEESKQALIDQSSENFDLEMFTQLRATNTSCLYEVAGVFTRTATLATATAAVTTADLLNPEFITKAKTWALTNRDSQIPLKPIKVDGKDYLILLVHPDCLADLENDTTFAQARREADIRGKENPIFSGAYAIWNGVVIHAHENISIGVNAGTVPYAQNFLLGERALVLGWAKKPEIVADTFSYGQETGFASLSMFGVKKPQFNSQDYGSVCVVTARTNISGI